MKTVEYAVRIHEPGFPVVTLDPTESLDHARQVARCLQILDGGTVVILHREVGPWTVLEEGKP